MICARASLALKVAAAPSDPPHGKCVGCGVAHCPAEIPDEGTIASAGEVTHTRHGHRIERERRRLPFAGLGAGSGGNSREGGTRDEDTTGNAGGWEQRRLLVGSKPVTGANAESY